MHRVDEFIHGISVRNIVCLERIRFWIVVLVGAVAGKFRNDSIRFNARNRECSR